MNIYLTFNDAPSGIYSSQVIDVVNYIREELKRPVKLVAFISLRGFWKNRRRIRQELADAIVLPMVPGLKHWRMNALTLRFVCLWLRPQRIIGRSVLATCLSLKTGVKEVIYDGRGAIAAEWAEYDVVGDPELIQQMPVLEHQAIHESTGRIAVSAQLLKHWQERFHYQDQNHWIIPCTLNHVFRQFEPTRETMKAVRQELQFGEDDVVFVYAGSLAGWQSFALLNGFLSSLMKASDKNKILFLSSPDTHIRSLIQEFPGRVACKRVQPQEVPRYLQAGDYGLLIRERSVTNEVASPVKFAEYLACGLPVLISEGLGDYTDLVLEKNIGAVITGLDVRTLGSTPWTVRQSQRQIALGLFTKEHYKQGYEQVFS